MTQAKIDGYVPLCILQSKSTLQDFSILLKKSRKVEKGK